MSQILLWFRDAPINRKMKLISLMIFGLALFAMSSIMTVRGWIEWRDRTLSDLGTYANVVGINAIPALVFDDRDLGGKMLAALAANPSVLHATIYDNNYKEFNWYNKSGHPPEILTYIKPGSYRFSPTELLISKSIELKGEVLGSIVLKAEMSGLYKGILRDTLLIFASALVLFLGSIYLFSRLQKTITDPILELAKGMEAVTSEENYAIRVVVQGKDEIGMLAQTFNGMLERIQSRDADLAHYRERLELEVTQRTAELKESNRLLGQELFERKRAEERIRESEVRYRGIFEYANDIIYLLNPDGTFQSLSPSFERITGWAPTEWIGKAFAPLIYPDDLAEAISFFQKALSGKSSPTFRLRIARKSGEYFDAELSITPLGREVITGAVGIVRDITERKQMEEKIKKLNAELEIKVQERTSQLLEAQEELLRKEKLAVLGQVAGSIGHEMRNPLGVMNNAVYLLQTLLSDADETIKEYLDIIKDELAGSERIVSGLLDSVRTRLPHPEVVGVAELIGQTLRKCNVPLTVTVELDVAATLPPLRVDAMQIHQVFYNLIRNGVEAMPKGGTLKIRAVANEQDGTVAISVRDSGVGIEPEKLGKLFQPLFTTKARGIGLGLVVVKNLTQVNGGTVQVESEAGRSTMFTVTLPTADVKKNLQA